MLKQLNERNDVPVLSVRDKVFETYGRVLSDYDFSELISYMERQTSIPQQGNVYLASVEELEAFGVVQEVQNVLYGGMPVQAAGEGRLLLQKNKWVIAHPEREPLMKQGAFPGLMGENKELFY